MKALLRLAMLCTLAVSSFAQGPTFHTGFGYTPLVGPISNNLDNGWNFQVGGGLMFSPHFGVIADYQYNGLGVPDRVLNLLAVPDGNAHVQSFTVGPEIRFATGGKVSPYIIGGIGWYRRTIEFTAPTIAPVTVFDPFYGFFFPAFVPADVVLGTLTSDAFGGNVGLGFNFRIGESHAKVFAETRYHIASTEGRDTQMLPFTIGIRW
jgi:Outer membrane protein beta-barrel domain